ncbi:6045_t:CDS:2 [Entrophospora sp. SA101]|nr:6045_t:CDS:2 [Entrophospora sp. SA101]
MSTINEIIVEIKELINLINENERHLREKFEKKQDIGGILDKILEETSGDNDFSSLGIIF